MAYTRVNWESGTKTREGYTIVNGETFQTVQPEYTGNTPVNADNLNIMDEGIDNLYNYVLARHKVLWTGTWSSGNITVEGISNYHSILVCVDSSQDPIPCYKDNNGNFVGSITLGNSTTNHNYIKTFRASLNDDTLTLDFAKELGHNASGNHNAGSTKTVYKIIGLDPIIE